MCVWKPIGSMIQVGSLVSSHFTPPAVLSSPMNLDLTQIKIIIIVFTIFTILNRDNKVIIFWTTLPYNIFTNQLIVCINNVDNTICVKSALKSPCVWEFLPQPPNQGLLHLWCLCHTYFIPKLITVGQNYKELKLLSNLLVSLSHKVVGSTFFCHLTQETHFVLYISYFRMAWIIQVKKHIFVHILFPNGLNNKNKV